MSFVSYKFIALSFFSCKGILCNLWTETLQNLWSYFIAKVYKKKIKETKPKPMHCSEDCTQDPKFWKYTWSSASDGFHLLRKTVNTNSIDFHHSRCASTTTDTKLWLLRDILSSSEGITWFSEHNKPFHVCRMRRAWGYSVASSHSSSFSLFLLHLRTQGLCMRHLELGRLAYLSFFLFFLRCPVLLSLPI